MLPTGLNVRLSSLGFLTLLFLMFPAERARAQMPRPETPLEPLPRATETKGASDGDASPPEKIQDLPHNLFVGTAEPTYSSPDPIAMHYLKKCGPYRPRSCDDYKQVAKRTNAPDDKDLAYQFCVAAKNDALSATRACTNEFARRFTCRLEIQYSLHNYDKLEVSDCRFALFACAGDYRKNSFSRGRRARELLIRRCSEHALGTSITDADWRTLYNSSQHELNNHSFARNMAEDMDAEESCQELANTTHHYSREEVIASSERRDILRTISDQDKLFTKLARLDKYLKLVKSTIKRLNADKATACASKEQRERTRAKALAEEQHLREQEMGAVSLDAEDDFGEHEDNEDDGKERRVIDETEGLTELEVISSQEVDAPSRALSFQIKNLGKNQGIIDSCTVEVKQNHRLADEVKVGLSKGPAFASASKNRVTYGKWHDFKHPQRIMVGGNVTTRVTLALSAEMISMAKTFPEPGEALSKRFRAECHWTNSEQAEGTFRVGY